MLKIVHLDTGPQLRGGQQQLLMLARGLRERGHEQMIVTLDGTALQSRAGQEGFGVWALPDHDPAHAHGVAQLRQLLRTERFQVVHAHDGLGQTLSWFASVGLLARRVASRRVTFLPLRALDTRVKYGWMCDAVIAVSNHVKQLLVGSGVLAAKIEVIPDGVEVAQEPTDAAARSKARAELGLREDTFVVGYLGALTHEKGHDVALNAMASVQKSLPDAWIILATDARGSTIVPCTNLRWLSPPQSLAEFFAALDLYIMPSRAEGLGSAALLALAHGVPVIASRVGGLPEVIEEGETGWFVPPGDPAALAEAIALAASDRARLGAMGEKARERAKQFSSTLMVDRTERLYRRLIHCSIQSLNH